jgi:hypothetical protein
VGDVLFQDPAQFSGVICCEINFVVGTVKGEPDCFVGVLAGKRSAGHVFCGPWGSFLLVIHAVAPKPTQAIVLNPIRKAHSLAPVL